MTALIIIASILLLLLILLLIPIRVHVQYGKEFNIDVRYLFIKKKILPSEEDKGEEKPKKQKKKEEKTKGEDEEVGAVDRFKNFFKREGFSGFVDFLKEVLGVAGKAVKRILKHTKISLFDLYMSVGGDDASDIAMQYGQISMVAYPTFSFILGSVKKCKKKGISIDCNYESLESVVNFEAKLRISPIFLLQAGLVAFFKSIPLFKRFLRSSKPEQRESEEDRAVIGKKEEQLQKSVVKTNQSQSENKNEKTVEKK